MPNIITDRNELLATLSTKLEKTWYDVVGGSFYDIDYRAPLLEKALIFDFECNVFRLVHPSELMGVDSESESSSVNEPDEMTLEISFLNKNAIKFGWALKDASEELKSDKALVLEFVKKCGLSVHYASTSLRRDPDVALAAVRQDFNAAQLIDQSLLENASFVSRLQAEGGRAFEICNA